MPDQPQELLYEAAPSEDYNRFLDGSNDAAFAQPPQFIDPPYLAGYLKKLQELPRDSDGKVIHSSPAQKFAFGWTDRSEGNSDSDIEEF